MSDETKQESKSADCCAGSDFPACCEQMKSMMQKICGDKAGSFDPAAMMAKMKDACATKQ